MKSSKGKVLSSFIIVKLHGRATPGLQQMYEFGAEFILKDRFREGTFVSA
jgi:hypothetical protein